MTRLHQHCETRKINVWGAIAIGVGGMVGGGIFAVLGLAATLAGGATPAAFLVAKEAKSSRWIAGLGVIACVGALAALVGHTYRTDPQQLWVLVGMVVIGFAIEALYLGLRKRWAD